MQPRDKHPSVRQNQATPVIPSQAMFEDLEQRTMLSVSLNPKARALYVEGTGKADVIIISRDRKMPGDIAVNVNGEVSIRDFEKFKRVVINGDRGNDKIILDDTYGQLPTSRVYQVFGDNGNDTITGGVGNDTLSGGAGDDLIDGREGNDTIDGNDGNDTIFGSAGNDSLIGSDASDVTGDDLINGGRGRDTIIGGIGNDTLIGGTEDDSLSGGDGDDQLFGNEGNDQLFGNDGDDILNDGPGKDLNTP